MKAIDLCRAKGVAVAPTEAATRKFVQRMREAFPDTVWVGCKNWYIDTKGTPILWPLTQDEHAQLLAELHEEDLDLTPARRG
jgi:hypothetical protein